NSLQETDSRRPSPVDLDDACAFEYGSDPSGGRSLQAGLQVGVERFRVGGGVVAGADLHPSASRQEWNDAFQADPFEWRPRLLLTQQKDHAVVIEPSNGEWSATNGSRQLRAARNGRADRVLDQACHSVQSSISREFA